MSSLLPQRRILGLKPTLRLERRPQDSQHKANLTPPVPLDVKAFGTSTIPARVKAAGERALAMGDWHGYRNAQVSAIAPTGTIGLLMDCDTTGIEPDFALVKFKRLAGGGYFKIINHQDDGRRAALHLGSDLQNNQYAK